MKKGRLVLAAFAVGIFGVAALIEVHAHGRWTYWRYYDSARQGYVCQAEHPGYGIWGFENRRPFLHFRMPEVDPAIFYDGTWVWRIGYSVATSIDPAYMYEPMDIRHAPSLDAWRWVNVDWTGIREAGGVGRKFGIEWHSHVPVFSYAATVIYFDDLMTAYDWVRSCQSGTIPPLPLEHAVTVTGVTVEEVDSAE